MLTVVIGGFFGDEGKGKICAYLSLADDVRVAVRTGSVNAGHTVVYMGKEYKLRIIPSAFVNLKARLLIAPGANLRTDVFWRELSVLSGFAVKERIGVDKHCSIIEPRHVDEEQRSEYLSKKIGSTKQGVGAAVRDRVMRIARLAKDLEELRDFIVDVPEIVHSALNKGLPVLIEGTQGTFLSLYHGTYPYVTSRDTTASAVCSEAGVGPKDVDEVVLVLKAYVTRVGAGPLEGELSPEEVAERGLVEYGTVTGRPRRVALFNFELAKRAVMLNSATQIALTRVDSLDPTCRSIRDYEKLSPNIRRFVEEIENELNRPVSLISTGPEVTDIIDRRKELGLLR
ncbi:MAG: adenylosuccinate synthetase [Thermoprotei archaeon]|nr:MAG: adenylosuccinate synthetase [Thermoprotei archaeon]